MRTTLTSNQTSRHPPDRETDCNETQADSWICEGACTGRRRRRWAEHGVAGDMVGSENTFDVAALTPEQRWRLAGDPGTAPGLLQSLAQYYPQTRVAVAGNPVTYPALLQWLGGLGDPAVSAAVAAGWGSWHAAGLVAVVGAVLPGDAGGGGG